jgi:hypothetical protein
VIWRQTDVFCFSSASIYEESFVENFVTGIIIIISGSTVLVRPLAASHRRFRNLIKTLVRTPLDEWSANRKGLYLHRTTQHRNTKKNIYISMPQVEFEPTIPITKRLFWPAVTCIRAKSFIDPCLIWRGSRKQISVGSAKGYFLLVSHSQSTSTHVTFYAAVMPLLCPPPPHTHTRARAHARTHAPTPTHTHTHTHTYIYIYIYCILRM